MKQKTPWFSSLTLALAGALAVSPARADTNPPPRFTFQTFDIPGASETSISDIRNDGTLVGRFKDTNGLSFGFVQDGTNRLTFNVTGTTATFEDYTAAFSPDGTELIFNRVGQGTTALYIIGVNGANERRLGTVAPNDTLADWK